MPYLDNDKKFWDYRTGTISGTDVIDLTTTGITFYDDFLTTSGKEYLKDKHNLKGEIVYMTPNEYYKQCGKYGFPNSPLSPDKLKTQRSWDEGIIEHLKQVLTIYKKKFPLPFLNIAEHGQEGLHRFYVIGELFGWDNRKYPVLVITHADKEEAKRREMANRINEISSNIRYAIQDTLRYYFKNLDELKDELQIHLNDKFQFDDEIKKPVEFTLEEDPNDPDYYIVKVDLGEAEIEKARIHYTEPDEDASEDEDLDIDIDELDDDLENFMSRYFGQDWKETHKDTFDKLDANRMKM